MDNKAKASKNWIDGLVADPNELPSHFLVVQYLTNNPEVTMSSLSFLSAIGEAWFLLGRAWVSLCDADKEFHAYFILNAFEDVNTALNELVRVGHKEKRMKFNITQDGFDDKVADKVKELCYLVLSYVYEWKD